MRAALCAMTAGAMLVTVMSSSAIAAPQEEPEAPAVVEEQHGAEDVGGEDQGPAETPSTPESEAEVAPVPAPEPGEAPETIAVEGITMVVLTELEPVGIEAGSTETPEAVVSHEGSVNLVTDGGNVIELEAGEAHDYASGQPVSATFEVPETVREEVVQQLDGGALETDELVELVAETAAELEQPLEPLAFEVQDLEVDAAVGAASYTHTVDVVYLERSGNALPSSATLSALISRLSAYWKTESNNQITAINVNATRAYNMPTSLCGNTYGIWNWAASQLGRTTSYYLGSAPRHLAVLESTAACSASPGTGLGTVGAGVNSGGLIWGTVDRAYPARWNSVTFHEFGHNISLGHANELDCAAAVYDTPGFTKIADRRVKPTNASCAVQEYWDFVDVMGWSYYIHDGNGNWVASSFDNVAALNTTQRMVIGAIPATAQKQVTAAGGYTQIVDLKPSTETGASTTRAITITPAGTTQKYVLEYRAGQGRDANALYNRWQTVMSGADKLKKGPGVRVLRDTGFGINASVALYRPAFSGEGTLSKYSYMKPGATFTANGTGFTARVISMTATNAQVEIKLKTPTFTAGSVAITGNAVVGQQLTATRSGWAPTSGVNYGYQWKRNGANIAGATAQTYTPVSADANTRLTVAITGSVGGTSPQTKSATSAQKTVRSASYQLPAPKRISGTSRYATAVEISKHAYPSRTGGTVIIATGQDYPDALSAAPLGAKLGAPMLLTMKQSLPQVTVDEINRLKPTTIYVIGGTGVISETVKAEVQALRPGATVQRLSGANRFETSAAIARKGWPSGSPRVFIATGAGFADALSAGSAAGSIGAPVVLVPGASSTAPSSTVALLNTLGTTELYVSGGTGAVSAGVVNSIKGSRAVERFSGKSRYDTSAKLGERFSTIGSSMYVANGSGFADALTGAVVAGVKKAPMLLSQKTCVPQSIRNAQYQVLPSSMWLLGGKGVLTDTAPTGRVC